MEELCSLSGIYENPGSFKSDSDSVIQLTVLVSSKKNARQLTQN